MSAMLNIICQTISAVVSQYVVDGTIAQPVESQQQPMDTSMNFDASGEPLILLFDLLCDMDMQNDQPRGALADVDDGSAVDTMEATKQPQARDDTIIADEAEALARQEMAMNMLVDSGAAVGLAEVEGVERPVDDERDMPESRVGNNAADEERALDTDMDLTCGDESMDMQDDQPRDALAETDMNRVDDSVDVDGDYNSTHEGKDGSAVADEGDIGFSR